MSDQPLTNKKIAILVESEYVPEEINAYLDRFRRYGATVDLMSRLWGNNEITFISDVTEAGRTPEELTVSIDFQDVDLNDYSAVIMAANYTSCRLRYFETPEGQSITGDMVRAAPASRFIRRAMMIPELIKGFLCHGLWILTPTPELLAGRRVICHEVVLADIVNAGGLYTTSETGVVIDDDVVTGHSYHEAAALADAIKDQIVDRRPRPVKTPAKVKAPTEGKRRVLVVLSEFGYWGEELVGPVHEYDKAGFHVDFCSPTGHRPPAIAVSMDTDYIDPPLGRSVTSQLNAQRTREFDNPNSDQGKRLNDPINLAAWFPERPYYSAPQLIRAMVAHQDKRMPGS